jgi:murein DD-endopeptidase MepM/ murein hydrolase activator NlpD
MAFKVGTNVQVTTGAGLRARKSPNGDLVKDAKGNVVVRPKGFRFTVTASKDGWSRAKTNWYSEEYLSPVTIAAETGKVASPCPGYKVSTPYKKRPNNNTYWQARGYHTGDDYAAPSGAKLVAVRSGTVKYKWDSVLGHCALLQGKDGAGKQYTWWYCHLRAKPNTGSVKPGQTIGHVGSTGSGAKGPHLHFEKRAGYSTSWNGRDLKPTW